MASLEVIAAPKPAAEVAGKRATDRETELLKQLNKENISVDVVFPDDINAEDFRVSVSAVSRSLVKAVIKVESLIPVLGRLLLVAQKHKELWESKYETYEALLASFEEEYGFGRSTLLEFRRLTERWGGVLHVSDFGHIGRLKLNRIGSVVDIGKEGSAEARRLLDYAGNHTTDELDKHLHEKYHVDRDPSGASFKIPGSKSAVKRWEKFFKDPRVQASCESDKMSDIMDHLIEEASAEWLVRGEELIREQAKQQKESAKTAEG